MAPPPPVAYFYIYPQAMTLGMSELCIVLVRPLPPTGKQAGGGWGSVYLLPADVAPTPPARQQVSGPGVSSGTSPGAEDGVGQQLQPPPRPPLPASLLGTTGLGAARRCHLWLNCPLDFHNFLPPLTCHTQAHFRKRVFQQTWPSLARAALRGSTDVLPVHQGPSRHVPSWRPVSGF